MEEKNSKGFSHITVGADFDDEDEVIVAGVVDAGKADVNSASAQEEAPEVVAQPGEEDVSELEAPTPVAGVDEEGADQEDEVGSRHDEPATSKAKPSPKRKDVEEYHDTTLEDLEGGDAPFAQKVVIVLAILAVIAIVVYIVTR